MVLSVTKIYIISIYIFSTFLGVSSKKMFEKFLPFCNLNYRVVFCQPFFGLFQEPLEWRGLDKECVKIRYELMELYIYSYVIKRKIIL